MEALGDESKLRIVEDPSRKEESDSTSESSTPGVDQVRSQPRSGRIWLWALLGLLLGLAVAFQQYRRAEGLESQVDRLNAELSAARLQIEAYDARFSDVRIRVGELDQSVEALKLLVESDPVAKAPSVEPSEVVAAPQEP